MDGGTSHWAIEEDGGKVFKHWPRIKHCLCEEVRKSYLRPLSKGALAVYVDAAVEEKRITMALVMRDGKGRLLAIQTDLGPCMAPEAAEVATLLWATRKMESKGLWNIDWQYDALKMVKKLPFEDKSGFWKPGMSCWFWKKGAWRTLGLPVGLIVWPKEQLTVQK